MASTIHQLGSYLPPDDGLLSKWLLFISIVSLGNSVQSYISLAGTREVYAGPISSAPPTRKGGAPTSTSPVTDLSARTFGTWTALSAIIRLYAAYHITDPLMYELALWTFGLAGAHFATEWLAFGTARWGRGLAGPVCVATGTGTWMYLQWANYVR